MSSLISTSGTACSHVLSPRGGKETSNYFGVALFGPKPHKTELGGIALL